MTDETMHSELEALRETARRFLDREVAPHREKWRKAHCVDREVWRTAGRNGLLLLGLPESAGGGGGDFRHEAVLIEELARIAFLDLSFYLHSVVVAPYIHDFGTQAQRSHWLPLMAQGEAIGAIAMSEPSTGSDLRAIQSSATRLDDGKWRLRGQKTFISNGALADVVIVACKTRKDEQEGISLFLVEKGLSGFTVGRHLEKVGRQAQDTVELFFDDVVLQPEALLGEVNGGLRMLMSKLATERLLIAVKAVASMETALAQTLDYVKERKAFGKRVMDFQNTKFKLAEAKTELTVARTFLDACVQELVVGALTDTKAAMAKWWCSDRQFHLIDECLQLFGGYGYMSEYPISSMWTDARVQKIYGGTNEIMKEIISRTL